MASTKNIYGRVNTQQNKTEHFIAKDLIKKLQINIVTRV